MLKSLNKIFVYALFGRKYKRTKHDDESERIGKKNDEANCVADEEENLGKYLRILYCAYSSIGRVHRSEGSVSFDDFLFIIMKLKTVSIDIS